MPNTFASLNVPSSDPFSGEAFDVRLTGPEKTFVFDGAVRPGGSYFVEGTADGGDTWDILTGRDGTQVFFAADNAGIKSVEAVVSHVRVRSERNGVVAVPPSITIGAPPAQGTNLFRVLPVPPANGLGEVMDLTDSAGPLKTLILRRGTSPLPRGSRYSILASMDGTRFDQVALFTAERQGTRTLDVLCRFMRVQREAGGDAPIISVGSEGLPQLDDRCLCVTSFADKVPTGSNIRKRKASVTVDECLTVAKSVVSLLPFAWGKVHTEAGGNRRSVRR